MKNREKLKAGQLAPFVGCDCYFNNGKDVLKGELTFLMLHQLEMGVCKEIVPILWGLDDMTEAEKELFGKVSDLGGMEEVAWLFAHSMDVYMWIVKGLCIDGRNDNRRKEMSIDCFEKMMQELRDDAQLRLIPLGGKGKHAEEEVAKWRDIAIVGPKGSGKSNEVKEITEGKCVYTWDKHTTQALNFMTIMTSAAVDFVLIELEDNAVMVDMALAVQKKLRDRFPFEYARPILIVTADMEKDSTMMAMLAEFTLITL